MSRRVAVLLAALAAPSTASAWAFDAYVTAQAPCPAAATSAELVREAVTLDCETSTTSVVRCDVVARYDLRNPTSAPLHLALAAPTVDARLSAPGVAAAHEVELVIAAGEHAEFTMRQRITREEERHGWRFRGFSEGALGLAHPLLVEESERVVRVSLSYERGLRCNAGWHSVGEAAVVTRAPRGWAPTTGWEQRGLCRVTADGADCLQVEATTASTVMMSMERPLSGPLRSGGFTLGLGGSVPHGLRARVGYEFGFARRWMGAASVEADTAGNVVVTPTVGYAFRAFRVGWWRDAWWPGAVVPWIGVPVGVLPDRRVGVRAQASLLWVFAGLDVAVDYWPVDDRVDVTVMLRVGL